MDHKLNTYKTVLYGTAAAALAIGALASLWYVSAYARSLRPESGWNTFTVTAEGKATGIPNIAQVSFSVSTDGGNDAAAVQQETNKKMDDIMKFLDEQGIKKDDIKTTSYNVTPRYQYAGCVAGICRPGTVIGYTVSQSVEVKIRDVAKAGAILSGAVAKGATGSSGPTFVVDDRTQLENEARGEAIAKAKVKAEAIAKQGDFKLGKLLSISDDNYGGEPSPYYSGAEMDAKGGAMMNVATPQSAPTIAAGSQDVTVNVSITYSIR